jgi:hypothetical protein
MPSPANPVEGVLPAAADTLLVISGFGNFKYQARGLTQSLELIGESEQLERTINGRLIDLSVPQFRKYKTTISVSDEVDFPPLDGVFPGMEITVDCALYLCYPTGRAGSPSRDEVSGSSYTQNGYTFYRPQLTMRVRTFQSRLDEWKRQIGWSLEAEEI